MTEDFPGGDSGIHHLGVVTESRPEVASGNPHEEDSEIQEEDSESHQEVALEIHVEEVAGNLQEGLEIPHHVGDFVTMAAQEEGRETEGCL